MGNTCHVRTIKRRQRLISMLLCSIYDTNRNLGPNTYSSAPDHPRQVLQRPNIVKKQCSRVADTIILSSKLHLQVQLASFPSNLTLSIPPCDYLRKMRVIRESTLHHLPLPCSVSLDRLMKIAQRRKRCSRVRSVTLFRIARGALQDPLNSLYL